jgi:hypothetical protein
MFAVNWCKTIFVEQLIKCDVEMRRIVIPARGHADS